MSEQRVSTGNQRDDRRACCIEEGCSQTAYYNYVGVLIPAYCRLHKLQNMERCRIRVCQYAGCKRVPRYNYQYKSIALYCHEHKAIGMVVVKRYSKRCRNYGCTVTPSFNYPGQSGALYCNTHKLEGMINIRLSTRRCTHRGCTAHASFGYEGTTLRLKCAKHRDYDMIDLKNTTTGLCKYISPLDGSRCYGKAEYNYEGQSKRLYCSVHRYVNMVRIKPLGECTLESCTAKAGFVDSTGNRYCTKHRTEQSVRICSNRCKFDGCTQTAQYNYSEYKRPKYCEVHKSEGMIKKG